jgi:hypothetical protein
MRMPPGLSPKLVTSTSDAAYAGRNGGTTRPAIASEAATPSSTFRLMVIRLIPPLCWSSYRSR